MNDLPYIQAKDFGPEVVANMTRIASEVRKILPPELPCGIQVRYMQDILSYKCINRFNSRGNVHIKLF